MFEYKIIIRTHRQFESGTQNGHFKEKVVTWYFGDMTTSKQNEEIFTLQYFFGINGAKFKTVLLIIIVHIIFRQIKNTITGGSTDFGLNQETHQILELKSCSLNSSNTTEQDWGFTIPESFEECTHKLD